MAGQGDHTFVWIVVIGVMGSIASSFSIGANDVANAFASSVGSKTLTLAQALLLAVPFEFAGAMLLGRRVAESVSEDVINLACFELEPDVLTYGMAVVLWVTFFWVIGATVLELPLSTTQAVISALLGVGLSYGGSDCIFWRYEREGELTRDVTGFGLIAASWVLTPIVSGSISALLFWLLRRTILRKQHNVVMRSILVVSISVFFVGFFETFLIINQRQTYLHEDNIHMHALGQWLLSGAVGFVTFIVSWVYFRRLQPHMKSDRIAASSTSGRSIRRTEHQISSESSMSIGASVSGKIRNFSSVKYIMRQLAQDMHKDAFKASDLVVGIHSNAEVFDQKTEDIYKSAQVIAAVFFAFSHGAHDVGSVEPWMLALCGAGICIGLLLYGYNIISALGLKMAKITPTRGAVITFSAYLVLTAFNRMSIPTSSTFCQVGATFGVALLEGQKGLNWSVVMKFLAGFLFTSVSCGLLAAVLFSQGIYSPSKGLEYNEA